MYETILTVKPASAAEFNPVPLTRFAPELLLSVQHTTQGPIIAAFHKQSHKLEIYDPEPGKFALFVYQLPPGTALAHFTSKLTFAVGSAAIEDNSQVGEHDLTRVAVISNLIAGTTANPRWFSKQSQSIMQQFSLPSSEKVRGIAPIVGVGGEQDSTRMSSEEREGFYLWTTTALYECRPKMAPERIFCQLLQKGLEKTDAEPLGKTFRLDLFRLYEEAGDRAFDSQDYGRALE
jgi:hypothetical protein